MSNFSWREANVRRPRIEPCEARTLMTAAPLNDLHVDYAVERQPSLSDYLQTAGTPGPLMSSVVTSGHGFTGAGQTVAVIDSGIAYDHPALGGGFGAGFRVVGGWDFTEENDANPYDDGPAGSHGTHVAGIIGSTDAASPGVAPGVDLVGLRVFNDAGNGSFAWIEKALQWVHVHRNDFRNPITTVNLSIGAAWNSDSTPGWSTIEDELAQLKADGMFIVAAAGNGFTSYNTVGVSYPAASSFVVPVASVDANGALSSFSQRDDRVIAAPGRAIRSTVPDYVGNLNGRADDFATFSGTSMAAPYVAGASVLIRQALQSVGTQSINEDTIYNVMRQTADLVYDPITNRSYTRLNLDRALGSIVSSDDFGAARDLGTIAFTQLRDQNLSGGDAWYSIVAGRSGTLTAELLFSQAGGNVDLELLNGARQLVGSSSNQVEPERVDVAANAGDVFYIHVRGSNNDVDLRLTNLVSRVGTTVSVAGTSGNDTFVFQAGTTHQFTINGVSYQFAGASVKNFVFSGAAGRDSATIGGTAANEIATLRPGAVELIGSQYRAAADSVETIVLNAGAGTDQAVLYDSTGDDAFTATPTWGGIL